RADVFKATGLTVSVGISSTKFVAKVASDERKPNGLTVVPPEEVRSFLDPLPIRRLWGVGPKAAEKLLALRLHTIAQVRVAPLSLLQSELGSLGSHIHALAHANDP